MTFKDRLKLEEQYQAWRVKNNAKDCAFSVITYLDIAGVISHERSLEQPEIIRCKDCKNQHVGSGFCPMVHMSLNWQVYEVNSDNDFCSKAQRKTK